MADSFINQRQIYLVGMMGSGKTTVGRILSEKLSIPFWDADDEIQKDGQTVAEIFQKGETFFRARESEILFSTVSSEGIFSCGGGVVVLPENRNFLKGKNVIYLYTDVPTLEDRLCSPHAGCKQPARPLLNRGLGNIFKERARLYEEVARLTVNTTTLTPPEVADKIVNML